RSPRGSPGYEARPSLRGDDPRPGQAGRCGGIAGLRGPAFVARPRPLVVRALQRGSPGYEARPSLRVPSGARTVASATADRRATRPGLRCALVARVLSVIDTMDRRATRPGLRCAEGITAQAVATGTGGSPGYEARPSLRGGCTWRTVAPS